MADDDPAIRSLFEVLISDEEGLELAVAVGDADAAIKAARMHEPDICVLDVSMPGGGGPRAARAIRAACPKARMIALSGHEDRDTIVEMLRAGVVGYVVKGATAEEIMDSLRRTARGEPALSAAAARGIVRELSDQWAARERRQDHLRSIAERLDATVSEGLLAPVFQPVCDLRSRIPIGFEALSRFTLEPVRSPDVWFAEAAEVGRLLDLEIMAVRAALAGLRAVSAHAFLAINVSPTTLCEPALLDLIRQTGAGKRVVIEVTEHSPIDDYDRVADALKRLRALGVRLAVDDAGAGFASLRHIVRLAPDFIKIDGTLTRSIDTDPTQRALTKALIAFAKETGSSIVAEGLETDAQVQALRELGVRLGQGYALGRPVPLETG